jgi:hypothetical protein
MSEDNCASEAARALGRARWKGVPKAERVRFAKQIAAQGAGRPRVVTRCPDCGVEFGARELRAHRPVCPVER